MRSEDKNRSLAAPRSEAGFTLLEIMIALGIILLIMGFLVLPNILGKGDEAKIKITKQKLAQFAAAYERWQVDHFGEDCPSSLAELQGGKRANKVEKDPWGREFVIKCGPDARDGEAFEVISGGPDKKIGTPDDISSADQ